MQAKEEYDESWYEGDVRAFLDGVSAILAPWSPIATKALLLKGSDREARPDVSDGEQNGGFQTALSRCRGFQSTTSWLCRSKEIHVKPQNVCSSFRGGEAKGPQFQGLGSIFSQVVYFGLAQNAVIFFTLLACDCAFLDGLEAVVAVCVGEAVGFGGTSGLVVVFKEDGTSLEDNVLEACEELEDEAVDDGEASEGAARVKT